MAAKGTSYANSLLLLIFNATTFSTVAQNASSSPITNLYVSLHTSSPGAGGNQTTNEAAYGSYARVAVARSSSGWTVTSNSVSNTNTITFPTATSGSETETYVGIGTASTGTGELLYFGPIESVITVTTGVTPYLVSASVITET